MDNETTKVVVTILQPASGGFGEWGWTEAYHVKEAISVQMYLEFAADQDPTGYALDGIDAEYMAELGIEDIRGRVQNQRGTIIAYPQLYGPGEWGPKCVYEMAWEE